MFSDRWLALPSADTNRVYVGESGYENETLHYKSGEDRTTNWRVLGGETYAFNSIEAEYSALRRQRDILGERVPEPVFMEVSENGPEGYYMRRIEGSPLCRYTDPEVHADINELDVERIVGQIEDIVDQLASHSEPHGDLNPSNFIVDEDSRLTLIDPVGYPEEFEHAEEALETDRWMVDETLEDVRQAEKRDEVFRDRRHGNGTEFISSK